MINKNYWNCVSFTFDPKNLETIQKANPDYTQKALDEICKFAQKDLRKIYCQGYNAREAKIILDALKQVQKYTGFTSK